MRIVFTGPEGGGKSTLVTEVASRLGYPVIPELVEETLKQEGLWHYDLITSLNDLRCLPRVYFDFQKRLTDVRWERGTMLGDNFVEDRSHMDGLACTLLFLRESVDEADLKEFSSLSVKRCQYDLILYVPRREDAPGEGRRLTSWSHVATYDFLLQGLYQAHGLAVTPITQSSVEGRVAEVLRYIEYHKERRTYSSVDW